MYRISKDKLEILLEILSKCCVSPFHPFSLVEFVKSPFCGSFSGHIIPTPGVWELDDGNGRMVEWIQTQHQFTCFLVGEDCATFLLSFLKMECF